MGYCDEGCEHLTRRHNCNKYHKGLAYFSYGSKSLAYSNHERCSECDKDHYIAELEDKIKTSWILVSERLPEEYREVAVTVDGKGEIGAFVSSDTCVEGDWHNWDGVVAWMPLPEPYRPE